MSRLAATTTAAFVRTFLEAGDDEDAVAERFASMTEELVPAVRPILVGAFNAHLRDGVRRGILGRAELEAGQIPDSVQAAVCFADLVGFTRLGGEVEPEELGSVAGGLAVIANEVVKPPVRLIKTIGDAAMFVSPEPAPLVAVALSLVEAVQAADLPALRAGIAFGPALLRAGDFYGHSVNLASRVTGIARPESVLCTTEVHDAAAEQFEWSFAGKHRLKGIPERVPLYRAHRIEAPAEESERRVRRRQTGQGSPRHPKTFPATRADHGWLSRPRHCPGPVTCSERVISSTGATRRRLSVPALARAARCSPAHFSRGFTRAFGCGRHSRLLCSTSRIEGRARYRLYSPPTRPSSALGRRGLVPPRVGVPHGAPAGTARPWCSTARSCRRQGDRGLQPRVHAARPRAEAAGS